MHFNFHCLPISESLHAGYCYLKHGYVIACAVDVDGKQLRLQLDKEGQNCYCVNAGDLQSHHCTCRDDYLQMLLRLLAHRVLMHSLLNNTLHMSLPIYICINRVNRWKLQVTSAHHSDFADCPLSYIPLQSFAPYS